jgi:hypothetical protein
LPDPQEIRGRVFDAHAHRIARGQVDPIERALNVGQTGRQSTDHIRVRSYAEAGAFHDPGKAPIGT